MPPGGTLGTQVTFGISDQPPNVNVVMPLPRALSKTHRIPDEKDTGNDERKCLRDRIGELCKKPIHQSMVQRPNQSADQDCRKQPKFFVCTHLIFSVSSGTDTRLALSEAYRHHILKTHQVGNIPCRRGLLPVIF